MLNIIPCVAHRVLVIFSETLNILMMTIHELGTCQRYIYPMMLTLTHTVNLKLDLIAKIKEIRLLLCSFYKL